MIVLGYDARERHCPRDRLWPARRIAGFLLADVPKPLSVDVFCWPSIFEDPQLAILALDDLGLGPAGLSAPADRGGVQGLWLELDALDAALTGADAPPHDVVAITTDLPWHRPVTGALPGRLGPEWTPLGLDIADPWLLGGLSNCGYDGDEQARLRPEWAPRLNRHHLFDDDALARAFAALSDARVPEHAPFFVYGIWRRSPPPVP